VKEDQLRFNGVVRNVRFFGLGLVGIYLSVDTTSDTLQLDFYSGYGEGRVVSWPDRAERLQMCFTALRELETKKTYSVDTTAISSTPNGSPYV
jgi:hypothetical protein